MVSGAFVSLKRKGRLRACCGGLNDRQLRLAQALQESAVSSALHDTRFPPVSPTELPYLDIEVWVLYSPQVVQAKGEERVHAVITGGKHGLVVARGEARGLLLPGVALEHGWDSRQFLEHVCIKAGMHPSLWKDDATTLMTFEGEAIGGPFVSQRNAENSPSVPPPIDPKTIRIYAAFCRDNIVALSTGATPNYYLFDAADGTVTGIVVHIHLRGKNDGFRQLQYSLRPGLPLQSSLFSLAQAAAQTLANQRFPANRLNDLEVELTVLWDPAMHGTVEEPDLRGLSAERRSLLAIERNKSGVSFNPGATDEQLLQEVSLQVHVSRPERTSLFSLETISSESPVNVSTAPRPVRGPAERMPGVAGTFYPAEPEKLTALVDELLAGAGSKEPWAAALVPHAGLRFSGQIAADVLKRIEIPQTVIILGPKHTPHGMEWAVAPHQTWNLATGMIESDFMLARKLAQTIPGLEMDAVAHQREHAIEVELPLIARLAPGSRVVGIVLEPTDLASCKRFAHGLAEVVGACVTRPLLLISSDMNHFATDDENRRLDSLAMDALENLDPDEVFHTVTNNGVSMCGLVPAVIVLQTLRLLGGGKEARRVAYGTSADVTQDRSRVVGYAGMLFN